MSNFKSQQEMVGAAFAMVLGGTPKKGLVGLEKPTAEQVDAVKNALWTLHLAQPELLTNRKDGKQRTEEECRDYIFGKGATCLVTAWLPDSKYGSAAVRKAEGGGKPDDLTSKIAALKAAVDAGLMSQADAAAVVASLLK